MRSHSYINSAKTILHEYDGSTPFAGWLKHFFKAHKKYGSRDRKEIAHVCYSYYRLGNAFKNKNEEERILLGIYLSSSVPQLILEEQKPEWNKNLHLSAEQKITVLNAESECSQLFPFNDELTGEIDKNTFGISFLKQPNLYLRVRPGKGNTVVQKLQKAGIDYTIENNCIALANSTKIEEFIELNCEAVIQDLNSQKIIELLPATFYKENRCVWDCCAASGGKSILLYDACAAGVKLAVSDIRKSILINLQKRFQQAGIKNYYSFQADLSSKDFSFLEKFDLVLCDAPCSGSGTWGRTPEQLKFFKKEKISEYAQLQKDIALNAAKSVKESGYFLYSTCSVFKSENEEAVAFIKEHTALQLQAATYFKGFDKRADTLFAALFKLELKK